MFVLEHQSWHLYSKCHNFKDDKLKGAEAKDKKWKRKKQVKQVFTRVVGASTSGVAKEDTLEKPKKKPRKVEKQTPTKKGGVPAKDTSKKITKWIDKKVEEEEVNKTPNGLMYQATKDKIYFQT